MNKISLYAAAAVAALSVASCSEKPDHSYVIDADRLGAEIQPTMYGVFFEDINYAADGGIYAEMIENRSFESPQQFQGWDVLGNVTISSTKPAFPNNPHYAALRRADNFSYATGLYNRGYFGLGLKEGAGYDFSVYARKASLTKMSGRLKVQLLDKYENKLAEGVLRIDSVDWEKYTLKLTSSKTDQEGRLRILLEGMEGVDIDHVSLFPEDNWNGLRPDLVQDLADLNPGIFRFPGGCVVEGTTLENRYQWKNSIGPAENRPMNNNRWNNTYDSKFAPSYYQSLGLGFYEYFCLAEKIGAEPVPILSIGLACQFQNQSMDAHASVKELGPFIQDAVDLVEFANGPVDSKWGSVRAEMGHPQPFNMKYIGIGNEQWGSIFPERLEPFLKIFREKCPGINVVGSAGPSSHGGDFDYLWSEMNRLGADLVDEHYYMAPTWFLSNAQRYDDYDRSWPKVFAGEFAAHVAGNDRGPQEVELKRFPSPGKSYGEPSNGLHYVAPGEQPVLEGTTPVKTGQIVGLDMANVANGPFFKNNFLAALCEAAFMTGLERNADVVYMSAYAPLFAHAQGYQWDPDLIWFDNMSSVRTPSYYVQQMYGQNSGTNVLSILEGDKKIVGEDGMYATACFDKETGDYIVKIANVSETGKKIEMTFTGIDSLGEGTVTTLHAEDTDYNCLENKDKVAPSQSKVSCPKNVLNATIPAKSFQVYRF
ncbi:MAG: alpha-L-arabinofuranosidase [Bacteroidales bacterium]|nr:alpha-L-arabinofuranosidase [Bacteroidales bacterium]